MRLDQLLSRSFSLLALAILASGSVFAADPAFGMVGVALGQTLRLNVVAFPPSPCIATLGFRDRNGSVPQPTPDTTVTLQVGQSAFLDINANSLVNRLGQRMELRPVVTLTQDVGPNACGATVEVLDNLTGFSTLAVTPQPEPEYPQPTPDFGMAGIALGQTLRLNVVAFPPNPCSATLGFRDRNGQPMPLPDKTVTLNPGEADFLDIGAASLGVQFGHRMELRPVVMVMPSVNDVPSACAANVEVYDSLTGRTSEGFPQPNPDSPQPEPDFGMTGIGLGQTLRLNVVAFPPTPCSTTLGFRDRNGQPMPLPDKTVTLQGGQADFLDFNANTLLNGLGQRVELRPVVMLTNANSPSACVATAEVIDNLTGASVLGVTPMPLPDSPQPEPDFGMAGIALGQILRVNVVAFPPDPCSATLGFLDQNGTPVPQPDKTVSLNPGQADFLDITAASLGVQFGHRVELQPVVTVMQVPPGPNANPSSVCVANVEVFDPVTGRTWSLLPAVQ